MEDVKENATQPNDDIELQPRAPLMKERLDRMRGYFFV